MERSRSIGETRTVAVRGGVRVKAVVIGSTAPATPSLSDLLRHGQSLCERGVLVRLESGGKLAVQAQRLRELNRTRRPMEPGLVVPAAEAQRYVTEARERLAVGDVEGSDSARGGTLPFPHRVGSSPCSGPRRPAVVVRALDDWRAGDGFENASETDMVAFAREGLPARLRGVDSVDTARAAAVEVEGACVDVWDAWAKRNLRGRAAQVVERAREVRAAYKEPAKKKRRASVAAPK